MNIVLLCYILLGSLVNGEKFITNNAVDGCFGALLGQWVIKNQTCAMMYGSMKAMCLMYQPEFSDTFMNCWDRIAQNETKEQRAKDYEYIQGIVMKSNLSMELVTDSLERGKVLTTPAPPKMSNISEPFAMSDRDIWGGYQTIYTSSNVRPNAYKWGALPSSWWAFVFVLRIAYYGAGRFLSQPAHRVLNSVPFRKFNAYFAIPALFGKTHSKTAVVSRFLTFNLPTRAMSFVVVVYFIMGTIISCWPIPMVPKGYYNHYFRGNRVTEYLRHLGQQSGHVCLQQFPFLWLFAGRNNFLMMVTGWSMDVYNVLHKAAGRVTTIMIVIHTIAYTAEFTIEKRYMAMWAHMGWKTGVVAFLFMVFNCIFGVHAFRRLNYEWFLILHIAGAVIVLATAFFHVKIYHGGTLVTFWVTIGVWLFDRIARMARIIISGLFAKAHIEAHEDNTLEITVEYSGLWKPYSGSHAYIHFVNTWFFLESHPFSIVDGVGADQGKLKFFVRVGKGITRRLEKKVMANGGVLDTHVWIDGPYGPQLPVNKFQEIVLISGGVGVSATYSHAQKLMTEIPDSTLIDLYWAVPTETPHTAWFKEELDHILQSGRVKVHVFISYSALGKRYDIEDCPPPGKVEEAIEKLQVIAEKVYEEKENVVSSEPSLDSIEGTGDKPHNVDSCNSGLVVHHGSMLIDDIITDHVAMAKGDMAVVVCGPGSLNDNARRAVAMNFQATSHYVEYFEESFSW